MHLIEHEFQMAGSYATQHSGFDEFNAFVHIDVLRELLQQRRDFVGAEEVDARPVGPVVEGVKSAEGTTPWKEQEQCPGWGEACSEALDGACGIWSELEDAHAQHPVENGP